MRSSILATIIVFITLSAGMAADPPVLVFVPESTKKVCQLTGDFDRALMKPTLSQTAERYGVTATDLGSSFEHKGRLYFLFGDTHGQSGDLDAVAWTTSTDPEKISLDFYRGKGGKWLPPSVPGIKQGAFEVPSGGVSIGGTMYVVFTTDHTEKKVMGRSVVASSDDDGRTFTVRYDLSRDKFINVSILPADGWLYIYGSGDYRKSSVCLARVRPADLGVRSKLKYFGGNGSDGQTRWVGREVDATPLFQHDVVGELSVAYLGPVKRYVMLYNSKKPRGITMRSAAAPSGPWSDGNVLFEPWRDEGYGRFIHISSTFQGKSDAIGDPQQDETWGGEYGPYIMGRFSSGSDHRCRVYYTMSTWNPYQVVIMQSDLRLGP